MAAQLLEDIIGPLDRIVAPSVPILTLQELHHHCLVEINDDDDLLLGMLEACTTYCENEIPGSRQIRPATFDLPLSSWWDGELKLRPPPLIAASVIYEDEDGDEQTWDAANYRLRKPWRQCGSIEIMPDADQPELNADAAYPVRVRFTAGYLSPVTVTSQPNNELTSTGRRFAVNDRIRFYNAGGSLPKPLLPGMDYYVLTATSNGTVITVGPTPGGTAVDITSNGAGLHFAGDIPATIKQAVAMMVCHYYQRRTPVTIGPMSKELELSVTSLLQSNGWGSYA